ncbi:hypothetical protein [Phenylobacterium sp.]|uniref:hypothetical protein n=1 Tax=Phenylobacterium sp. TaxID=1871053 RepID=UPI0025F8324C|nr:hypothetical protein [Phenylobacterium sp.]
MPRVLKSYVAIDVAADGRTIKETFTAPHDTAASRRALFAAEGVALSLWRGEQLIGRWRRSADRNFRPAPAED